MKKSLYLYTFEMWCYRRMIKIGWKDRFSNKEVLQRVQCRKHFLKQMQKRKMWDMQNMCWEVLVDTLICIYWREKWLVSGLGEDLDYHRGMAFYYSILIRTENLPASQKKSSGYSWTKIHGGRPSFRRWQMNKPHLAGATLFTAQPVQMLAQWVGSSAHWVSCLRGNVASDQRR